MASCRFKEVKILLKFPRTQETTQKNPLSQFSPSRLNLLSNSSPAPFKAYPKFPLAILLRMSLTHALPLMDCCWEL